MKNDGYYFQQPTGKNPYGKLVIPDLEAFKAKVERLENLGKSPVTNAFSYSMEASMLKVILALYEKQEGK